jgi:hypothetical protein
MGSTAFSGKASPDVDFLAVYARFAILLLAVKSIEKQTGIKLR